MKSTLLKFLVSLTVSLSLLYYTLKFFELDLIFKNIQKTRGDFLLYSLLLIIVAYMVRGIRWQVWERELNFRDAFQLILIGFMGNNLLPARLGEFLRAYCTGHRSGEGYGGTAALASVAIERILDGLVISLIGLLGLILVPVPPTFFYALLSVSLLFGLLTLGLIISLHFHHWIRRSLERLHNVFPGHLTRFGMEKSNYFLDGLLLIKSLPRFATALLLSALVWSIETWAYYLIAVAVFPGISFKISLLFLAVVNFASLFPFTIGGIGVIEGATTAFLIGAGVPGNQALVMVILQHAFQFGFTTVGGLFFYFLGGYFSLSPASDTDKQPPMPKERIDHIRQTFWQIHSLSENLDIHPDRLSRPELSVVIPAYNEQNRLPKTVLKTLGWFAQNPIEYELIIADDGSTDDTLELAKLFAGQVERVRFLACPHQGKGATVRMGMLNATGKYVMFMDADGATPLEEIPKILNAVRKGTDIAIGSRVVQNPRETTVISSKRRHIMGRIFSAIVNIFVISGVSDTQCGFKIFRHEVVRLLFNRQKLTGFAFDVEILYMARKFKLSLTEVPINWINQEGSKINLFLDSLKMLGDIFKIRWIHRRDKWVR